MAAGRFGTAAQAHFRASGGDPDGNRALGEIAEARRNPGAFWVGPTVMELGATKLEL